MQWEDGWMRVGRMLLPGPWGWGRWVGERVFFHGLGPREQAVQSGVQIHLPPSVGEARGSKIFTIKCNGIPGTFVLKM